MKANRGFTLIEILVVVAIMTVMLGMTVLRLESSDSSQVKQAAERLSLALERARDAATISGRSVAFSSDGSGYQFWQASANQGEWAILKEEGLEPQILNEKVRLIDLRVNAKSRPLGERLVFSPDGVADTFEMVLQAGETRMKVAVDVMGRIELRHAPA